MLISDYVHGQMVRVLGFWFWECIHVAESKDASFVTYQCVVCCSVVTYQCVVLREEAMMIRGKR